MRYDRCWEWLAAALLLPGLAQAQTGTPLVNGVPQGVAGAAGSVQTFYLDVPVGQSSLTVGIGSYLQLAFNFANLYVNFGEPFFGGADPNPVAECVLLSSEEHAVTCEILNPAAGRWYLEVKGISDFEGYSVLALAATAMADQQPTFITGEAPWYYIDVPSGQKPLYISMSGGLDAFIVRSEFSHVVCEGVEAPLGVCKFFAPAGGGRFYVQIVGNQTGVGLTADYAPAGSLSAPGEYHMSNASHLTVNGAQYSIQEFILEVPAGLSSLRFVTATFSEEADADIYVNFGEPYLTGADSTPECVSVSPFNEEECEILNPAAGNWYVEVYGASEYFDVGLVGLAAKALQNGQALIVAGAASSRTLYYIDVPSGQNQLTVGMSGGTGNPGLCLYRLFNHNCNSPNLESPVAGRYYLLVNGTTEYAGVTLLATYFGPDATPDPFLFTDQTGVSLSTQVTSDAVTITGFDTAAAISVTNGTYSINGGAFVSTAGTVTNGQLVQVRHTSSAAFSTATHTVLTVGGVSDTFTSTTAAQDPPAQDPPSQDPPASGGGGGALPALALGVLLLAGLAARVQRGETGRSPPGLPFAVLMVLLAGCRHEEGQTPNISPAAAFTAACTDQTCQFSNSSSDPDGTVVAYAWTFGDGGTSSSKDPLHVYAAPGQFTVTLTVTDDDGAMALAQKPVTVQTSSVPSNTPPSPVFTAVCTDLTCQLTNFSTDPDGTIIGYAWNFGDGAVSSDTNPSHTYATPGQFTVTLTVTDDDGAVAIMQAPVTVQAGLPPNTPPSAAFTVACDINLICQFTNGSSDLDGTIAAYFWNFGDGTSSAEANPSHAYAAPGQFTVTLMLTDNDGAMATAQTLVTVEDGPDRSGTYERQTPHGTEDRQSRFVIRADRTFELHDVRGSETTIYTGRWRFMEYWSGWTREPGSAIGLDFDAFAGDWFCFEGIFGYVSEGAGTFLSDDHLAIAYCGYEPYFAGLEEGVYSSTFIPGPPGLPPPQAGQVAFVRDGAIHVANTDGTGVVQLTDGPDDYSPAWSPDGSRIAFTRRSGTTSSTFHIFVMNADGSNAVQRATSGPYPPDPTWSPDGEWIAFAGGDGAGRGGIYKVRADGPEPTPVTVYEEFGQTGYPAWSPDGSWIAFTSDRALYDIVFNIWLIAPDGSQLTPLTTTTAESFYPGEHYQFAWSPDGQKVAYMSCPWGFYFCSSSLVTVMNADGTGVTYPAITSGFASLTWSPDGQVIAYASSGAIDWVSADGSQRGRILDNGHEPAWRP